MLDTLLNPRPCDLSRLGYADDFLVMVDGPLKAKRVMASLSRFVEGHLKLVVNRAKSKVAPLQQCAFLGFQIGQRGKVVWTAKALTRFQRRVKEITSRNRGIPVQDVISELRRYILGWLNYFGISYTPTRVKELAEWVRRRVRMYYWKQWKRPGTRWRHLLALGIPREEIRMATRSRKGYWRMSGNSIVQRALTNRWLHEHGVPDMQAEWIALHYGPKARV